MEPSGEWPGAERAPAVATGDCNCFRTWVRAVKERRFTACLTCWRLRRGCWRVPSRTVDGRGRCQRCGAPAQVAVASSPACKLSDLDGHGAVHTKEGALPAPGHA
jgi:hypothetical protein